MKPITNPKKYIEVESVMNISSDPKKPMLKNVREFINVDNIMEVCESYTEGYSKEEYSIVCFPTGKNLMVKYQIDNLLARIRECDL